MAHGMERCFPPLGVGSRFVVMAPWHKGKEPEGRTPLYIYPGSAFGTGYHESTQIALELLEHTVKPGMKVIDVVPDRDPGRGSSGWGHPASLPLTTIRPLSPR
jgi:ribosomal protein L11 methylase PrmA